MTDLLRDIVDAAVAEILHDHGPTNSDHLKATADWRDCARSEVHAEVAAKVTDSPLVSALLDVVDAARVLDKAADPVYLRGMQDLRVALDRLAALEDTNDG